MPLIGGVLFAGYRVERLLGAGGMGEVYLARHPRLPRFDAIKILPAALTEDAAFRERFNREADVASSLFHPHIVGVHDRGEFDGQLWLSMDFVDGTDAGELVRDGACVPVGEVVEIVGAIAEALDFAHGRRLLHRDVKPANILLATPTGGPRRIMLADFGIARLADEASGLTSTNFAVGTVSYSAPEQLRGEPLDGRADQYALAATAFHLLAGRPPFADVNPAVVIGKHLTATAPQLSEVRAELRNLDSVLLRGLAKDRGGRYLRCGDFADALRDAAEGEGGSCSARVTPPSASASVESTRSPMAAETTMAAGAFAAAPTQLRPINPSHPHDEKRAAGHVVAQSQRILQQVLNTGLRRNAVAVAAPVVLVLGAVMIVAKPGPAGWVWFLAILFGIAVVGAVSLGKATGTSGPLKRRGGVAISAVVLGVLAILSLILVATSGDPSPTGPSVRVRLPVESVPAYAP